MASSNLVIGLLGIAFGVAFVVARKRLAEHQRRRTPAGTGSIPPAGWAAAGFLFVVTGVLQLIAGVR